MLLGVRASLEVDGGCEWCDWDEAKPATMAMISRVDGPLAVQLLEVCPFELVIEMQP
jgi:hypothetical protein